jgi:hypothetical protein
MSHSDAEGSGSRPRGSHRPPGNVDVEIERGEFGWRISVSDDGKRECECGGDRDYPPYVCRRCDTIVPGPVGKTHGDPQTIDPETRVLAQRYGWGKIKLDEFPRTTTLTYEWPLDVWSRLLGWFATFAPQNLDHLLRAHPLAIAHPLVFRQLAHLLWGLRRKFSLSFAAADEVPTGTDHISVPLGNVFIVKDPNTPASIPPPYPRNVEKALRRMLIAFGEGLLPGSRVKVTEPRHRGRQDKYDVFEKLNYAVRFRTLRRAIDKYPASVFRQGSEPEPSFNARLAKIVTALPTTDDAIYAIYGTTANLWRGAPHPQLSEAIACQIVERARARRRNLKDRLAYELMAYHAGMRAGQMEGIVNRARKVWPQLRRGRG